MLWSNMYSAASPRFTIHSAMGGRPNAERHVLRVSRAGGVIIAADSANAAGDEMGVARVFALHENAVAAKDGRSAVALRHLPILKIDLGENAKAADDPRDRIPIHLHQLARTSCRCSSPGAVMVLMIDLLSLLVSLRADSRW